jgi:hypothetical protein
MKKIFPLRETHKMLNTTRFRLKPLLQYTPWVVLYAILLTLYTINYQYNNLEISNTEETINLLDPEYSNILDGCYHVYLDVGSNLGIQVRKLFEPFKYPKAKIQKYFDIVYGNETVRNEQLEGNDSYMCAVGFEPNSKLSSYLKEVESAYHKCGWRVKFLTETAVSDHYESAQFYTDGEYHKYEWGGGILPNSVVRTAKQDSINGNYAKVNVIRLSDFLKHVVGKRRIPKIANTSSHKRHKPPRVVMKMDIEGSEMEVIPDLLFSGGLEHVNILMMEWHDFIQIKEERKKATWILKSIIESMGNYSTIMEDELREKHKFRLLNIDDETYYRTKLDLPNC